MEQPPKPNNEGPIEPVVLHPMRPMPRVPAIEGIVRFSTKPWKFIEKAADGYREEGIYETVTPLGQTIVVYRPKYLKQLFLKESDKLEIANLQISMVGPLFGTFKEDRGDESIVMKVGPRHRSARKEVNPSYTSKEIRNTYFPVMVQEAKKLSEGFEDNIEFDIKPRIVGSTLDVISEALLGPKFSGNKKVKQAFEDIAHNMFGRLKSPMPLIENSPASQWPVLKGITRRSKAKYAKQIQPVKDLVNSVIKYYQKNPTENPVSLVDGWVHAQKAQISSGEAVTWTNTRIGYETVAALFADMKLFQLAFKEEFMNLFRIQIYKKDYLKKYLQI